MCDHTTEFCPKQLRNHLHLQVENKQRNDERNDRYGRPKFFQDGKEICNNFNDKRGCTKHTCSFLHICNKCRLPGHSQHLWNKRPSATVSSNQAAYTEKEHINFLIKSDYLTFPTHASTPIDVSKLERELLSHPDKVFVLVWGMASTLWWNTNIFRLKNAKTTLVLGCKNQLFQNLLKWSWVTVLFMVRSILFLLQIIELVLWAW